MEDVLKTYYGILKGDGGFVSVRNKGRAANLSHHVMHSPDEFTWGSGGPGTIELARCLLFDAFGISICPDYPNSCECRNEWVEPNYQGFMSDVISKLVKGESWKLEQLEICEWVFDNMTSLGEEQQEVPVG